MKENPTKKFIFTTIILIFWCLSACSPTAAVILTETEAPPAATLPATPGQTKTNSPIPTSTSTAFQPTPTLASLAKPVTFTTKDGVQLAGTIFGDGEQAVILAHQGSRGADQNTWHEFARVLAEHGFTALAFDFRGNGNSGGVFHPGKIDLDIVAAIQLLREIGHEKIVCVGASMGGTACTRAAIDDKLAGLVTLGSTMMAGSGNGIEVTPDELASLTLPKLFITAEQDSPVVVYHTKRMHESSSEPKALYLIPGAEHGTDLFHTKAAEELTTILLEFLENLPDPLPIPSTPTDLMDRGSIVFYSERDGNAEIYTMKADGSEQLRLTSNQFEDSAPVWSPDGSQIAFISDREDPQAGACFPKCLFQLYLINADGSDERQLVQTEFTTHHPDWHPDGTKISFDTEFNLQGDIYTVNSDGSNLQRLIEDGFWASWSPDGMQVAFASNRDGNVEIYLADADGSNQRRLTNNDRMDFFPAWSPDGERIAFMAGDGHQRQIYLINADGNGEWQLTHSGRINEDPSWSPDGKSIVFQSDRYASPGTMGNNPYNFEIVVMDADGGNVQRLTDDPAGDYWPSWGPITNRNTSNTTPVKASLEYIPQSFDFTDTPQVALGDLDGDGDIDMVFANMGSSDSQVWLNDGAGQFSDSGQILTQQAHGVGLGDLDGDGDLDIFMTCASYDPGDGWRHLPSKVYLNNGRGTFMESGQDFGDKKLSGTGLNLIDLDRDGDLDAHVIFYDEDGMPDKIYLNDGTGWFSDSGLALTEDEIAWGDLDADGDADIVAKIFGEGYRVLLNNGSGKFTNDWELENSDVKRGDIALVDFDSDGDLDALIANGSSSGGNKLTQLLWNDGKAHFTDSGQHLNKTTSAKFNVDDIDQDGDIDVFVSNADQPNEVWLNDGSGVLTDSGLRLEVANHWITTYPSLGDLDGDGDLDVVVAGFGGKVEIWINKTPLPVAQESGPLIVFTTERKGVDDIYVMAVPDEIDIINSEPRNITNQPDLDDTDPRWSPDGSQIAFSSIRDGNFEIYIMNSDGSDIRRLTDHPAIDTCPTWSPDGTRIAFTSRRDGNVEIYLINTDGENLHRLTYNNYNDFEIDWSPDGRYMAVSSEVGPYGNVFIIDIEAALQDPRGETRQQLTTTQAHDAFPRWSPDGSQIAFISDREGDKNWEIYVMNADGSDQRRLTQSDTIDGPPSWSPDGKQLIFETNRDGNFELYIINSDGLGLLRLTYTEADDRNPDWQPAQ